MTVALAFAFLAAIAPRALAAHPTRTLGKDPGVRVPIPDGFDPEGKRQSARVETLALTDGLDVLVVTVYRSTDNDRAPTAQAALRAHAEELGKAIGADEHLASTKLAGREVPSRSFEYKRSGTAYHAMVVALDAGDTAGELTIVAVWAVIAGGPSERELAGAVAAIETVGKSKTPGDPDAPNAPQ